MAKATATASEGKKVIRQKEIDFEPLSSIRFRLSPTTTASTEIKDHTPAVETDKKQQQQQQQSQAECVQLNVDLWRSLSQLDSTVKNSGVAVNELYAVDVMGKGDCGFACIATIINTLISYRKVQGMSQSNAQFTVAAVRDMLATCINETNVREFLENTHPSFHRWFLAGYASLNAFFDKTALEKITSTVRFLVRESGQNNSAAPYWLDANGLHLLAQHDFFFRHRLGFLVTTSYMKRFSVVDPVTKKRTIHKVVPAIEAHVVMLKNTKYLLFLHHSNSAQHYVVLAHREKPTSLREVFCAIDDVPPVFQKLLFQ